MDSDDALKSQLIGQAVQAAGFHLVPSAPEHLGVLMRNDFTLVRDGMGRVSLASKDGQSVGAKVIGDLGTRYIHFRQPPDQIPGQIQAAKDDAIRNAFIGRMNLLGLGVRSSSGAGGHIGL